jgi:antitoxin (DNA-binding transcriptional repressor) of toxin-antitoxin stability system
MIEINASEFKAKCLAILDEVFASGQTVTILKRGKPVAQLVPPVQRDEGWPQTMLAGSVEIVGNVIDPALDPEVWEVESGESS